MACADTKALMCGGAPRFFQGEARNDSPFFFLEEQTMTISKTAVFNALREGGRKLSLRVREIQCGFSFI